MSDRGIHLRLWATEQSSYYREGRCEPRWAQSDYWSPHSGPQIAKEVNVFTYEKLASPDGWAVWGVVMSTRWWLLVDHCVLRNWDRILVRAVKGLISRAGMVSICPLLWQRDVKLQQTNIWKTYYPLVFLVVHIMSPVWWGLHNTLVPLDSTYTFTGPPQNGGKMFIRLLASILYMLLRG